LFIVFPEVPQLFPIQTAKSYHEGARVALVCTPASGDIDSMKYEWFKYDSSDKPSAFPVATDRGVSHSALTFRNVEAKDSGKYTCVASNRFGSHNVSAILNVDLPLKWKIEPMNQEASVGASLSVECQAFGHPEPTVRWRRLKTVFNETIPGQTLNFTSTTQSDAGIYECIALNGRDENLRKVIELKVKGVYDNESTVIEERQFLASLSMQLKNGRYQEGARVTLVCTTENGDIDSIKYEWFKHDSNGKPSAFPLATDSRVGHSILIFQSVEAKDSGMYTCVASNRFGSHNMTAVLNVDVPLRWTIEPANKVARVGDSLSIECQASGQPEPTVRWTRLRTSTNVTMAGPILIFPYLARNDTGIYECVASNGIDENLRKVIELQVKDVEYEIDVDSFVELKTVNRFQIMKTIFLQIVLSLTCMIVAATSNRKEDSPLLLPIPIAKSYHEGARVALVCTPASGDIDSMKYEWFKYDSSDKPSAFPVATDRGVSHSALTFRNAEAKDSGKYTCVASNRFGSHNVSTILNVDVPLKWKIEPTNRVDRVGTSLSIECQAAGHPEPTVRWTRLRSKSNVTIAGSVLHFPSLTQNDAGIYECVASNSVDENLRKVIELEVKGE
ncbi:Hemicentin-2, partial [Fragariocoptes setiger]